MRIIVVGASGDIGQAACRALEGTHDLIRVGRSSGDITADMSDPRAVAEMYRQTGPVDAVVCTAGEVHFALLLAQTHATMMEGLAQKTMGQINLVLQGLTHVSDGGSFTLTSGILDRNPVRGGVGAATANGALAGFVTGAAIEMPRRLRLNVVSPGMLDTSARRYGALFPGHIPVPDHRVGQAYVKCVDGAMTGRVICVD
ncbi:short chain dehydrogenase [Jannaschia sp. CCS1]|uniref:short chain dehydrogenase n=1 Tax=Jannaschia sp. (strain CCS1) TaxID=290400 RepID=UPI000053CC5C|nr:short chain dehydrogenase [Jannaschia sp. CCS1]ABD55429.1 short-chain dehydrogenase/reductase SDR [Jannaschia sp. CCS1]